MSSSFPGKPTLNSPNQLTVDSGKITWTYTGAVDDFRIYRNGVNIDKVPWNIREYTYTGLQSNTSYDVNIDTIVYRSINIGGGISIPANQVGGPSDTKVLRTLANQPTNITSTNVTGTNATLSWTASTSPSTVSYKITQILPTTTVIGTTSNTFYSLSNLSRGTSYTFNVTSLNAIGTENTTSPATTAFTTLITVPDTPINVTIEPGTAQVTVLWNTPTSNGGTAILFYRVTNVITGNTYDVSSNVTSATITGLTAGTIYAFTVKAYNTVGFSQASPTVTLLLTVPGVIPCFFGNARVLTPGGYRRMDALVAGDKVVTPTGTTAAIQDIKRYTCVAGPATNPYVIPAGIFGAVRRLLISPDHKVCLEGGRKVEARRLGLNQEERTGTLKYYNLELEGFCDMVVEGVAVESLQSPSRERMTVQELGAMLREHYGEVTPAILARVKRTCRFFPDGTVEVPVTTEVVVPRPHKSA
jgi:hypothetical protein